MTKKEPSAQVKASIKYNKANVKQVKINLNRKTDADIIEYLEKADNIQGLIKDLIRQDMYDDKQEPVITKKIIEGEFLEGQFVVVEIDGKEFRRKVFYSTKWGDLIITVYGNEYAKYEFET